jgi:hypothetical protein
MCKALSSISSTAKRKEKTIPFFFPFDLEFGKGNISFVNYKFQLCPYRDLELELIYSKDTKFLLKIFTYPQPNLPT